MTLSVAGPILADSVPWGEQAADEAKTQRSKAWEQGQVLARHPRILDRFAQELDHCGIAGERRLAKLIYLAVTSRCLQRPVSVVVKGPSSGGKSYTAVKLHPENETRLLSLTVTDTPSQTHDVLMALADEQQHSVDCAPWHALQTWIEGSEHQVTIPYAKALAEKIPPVAVRLRRDFGAVLNLIRAHAILQQATRQRDSEGRIIADLDDYAVVRELVHDLVAEGVDATVPATIRETVEAVKKILATDTADVSIALLAQELKIDKAAVSRRARAALDRGFLTNQETKRGLPARLVLGDLLPREQQILPTPEEVLTCCGVDGGDIHPPPPRSVDVQVAIHEPTPNAWEEV